MKLLKSSVAVAITLGCLTSIGFAQAGGRSNNPDAIVDLAKADGVKSVNGQWRFSDVKITEVDHHEPGEDGRGSGKANRTNDIEPHAGALDFDDSKWLLVEPTDLGARRAHGRLCFAWYRINITIPAKVGDFDTAGSVVVFETTVDDYAEVWVDGKLPLTLGQSGGPVIAGWNAPNRLVIGRDVKPGQKIQLALFGANGPLSDPPGNYIFLRSATLDFYRPEHWSNAHKVDLKIDRRDPRLDEIVSAGATLEQVARGFAFTEGPVWIPASSAGAGARPALEGHLLFSDPNRNMIWRCTEDGDLSVFRAKSGYTGEDIAAYTQPGSNGLTTDREDRLTICEHGNRRVTRLEKNGVLTVLADRFEGKRLNSPNDLVYRSDGALFFTDPPFGLPKFGQDPRRESPYTGVYCLINGNLKLVSNDLTGPNGIAFSPDEKRLYVGDWDEHKKIVMAYDVAADGMLSNGRVFFDMTAASGQDAIDGIKVDQRGNLYVSGPGGLWIIGPDANHLGTLAGPEHPHNMTWGGDDGRTLYWAAQTGIYRLRTGVPGIGPWNLTGSTVASMSGASGAPASVGQ